MIEKQVVKKVLVSLDSIECDKGIKILLAIESGSRAWGFPSKDSDYDVRIIYAKKQPDYLTVFNYKDTVEMPITDELDVAGWDISKAIKLMYAGNAVIHEWLNSPIVYRKDANKIELLNQLAKDAFNPIKAFHHYRAMCLKKFKVANEKSMSAKRFLYGFRTLMCALYVSEFKTAPPMLITELLEYLAKDHPIVKESIENLILEKRNQKEHDEISLNKELSKYIEDKLQFLENCNFNTFKRPSNEKFDSVFRAIIK